MTEETKPKLGQDDDDLFVAIMGLGYAVEVDLLPDECPLCAWDAALPGIWLASGTLYLTNQRLVWIRWRFGLPWIPKVVLISLDDVVGVETRRLGPGMLFERAVVVHLGSGRQRPFTPARGQPRVDKVAEQITNILRERGLLRD